MDATKSLLIGSLFLCCGNVSRSRPTDKEPVAIIEIGGAAGRSLKGGGSSFGPTVAVEVTPIENWLELEAGITPLFVHHSTEWDADLCSRSHGPCPTKRSLCSALVPSGFTRTSTTS